MIRFVSVVGGDTSLLSQSIEHYRTLGVEKFHVVRHTESFDTEDYARSVEVMRRHGLSFVAEYRGPWDEDLNWYFVRAEMRRHPNDWWVLADLDEFHVYDRALSDVIALCEQGGHDYVEGAMLDRVAADGSFPEIDDSMPLWQQFPLAGLVTHRVVRGVTRKVTLARGSVEVRMGQHWALSGSALPVTEVFPQIHHFKWTSSAVSRIARRLEAYSSGEWNLQHPVVIEENKRLLEHVEAHGGRIAVEDPEIRMHVTGGDAGDYPGWADLSKELMVVNTGAADAPRVNEPALES